jgi:hypothetical protein
VLELGERTGHMCEDLEHELELLEKDVDKVAEEAEEQ